MAEAAAAPRMRPWHVPITGRDPNEAHRTSTPLELLFDLCSDVGVAHADRASR